MYGGGKRTYGAVGRNWGVVGCARCHTIILSTLLKAPLETLVELILQATKVNLFTELLIRPTKKLLVW